MLPQASTSLPLTWVAPAAASTTTLDICCPLSGPGTHPDRMLEWSGACWSEARDGCCSLHWVAPCASWGLYCLLLASTACLQPPDQHCLWWGSTGHPHDSNLLPAGSADPCREGASTHGLGGSSETS
jgi:hypothetical protein